MKIKTDHKTRLLSNFYDLPAEVQKEFDWFDPETRQGDFVQYRGNWYCLDEFMRVTDPELLAKGWQGIEGHSAFSAVVMKYSKYHSDYVIMGFAYW